MVSIGMEREKMGSIKHLEYRGNHPDLINGQSYTYREFAKVAGVSYRTFVSRAFNKRFISDAELVPLNTHKIPKQWKNKPDLTISRMETYIDQVSQNWLRKSL